MQIEEQFGQVIRKRREKNKISQEAFAELAGVHRTYVSSIERGKVQVSIGVAQRLAEALETTLSSIWREIERSSGSE
jgi:transcriptional regulator with XRE-family HTH domain